VSDQGFIGETEAHLLVVILGGRQPWKVRSWRRSDRVIRSDRFQLSEGVQSSRLRVGVISEVKKEKKRKVCCSLKILRVNRRFICNIWTVRLW
jgi:hypothetical protein